MTERKDAEAFVVAHGKDISETEAAAAIEFLTGHEDRYYVEVIVAGIGGYLKVTVNRRVDGRDWFCEGTAGATSLISLGKDWGHCYTKDVARLLKTSAGFNVNAVAVLIGGYVNVNFFDGNSQFLGHLHGGGLSNLVCTGGGTGSWR